MSLSTTARSRVDDGATLLPDPRASRAGEGRRVRQEVADGLLVMGFSLAASALLAAGLVLISVLGS